MCLLLTLNPTSDPDQLHALGGCSLASPSLSFHSCQPQTTSRQPLRTAVSVNCRSRRESTGQAKLSPGPNTDDTQPLRTLGVSSHPQTGNIRTVSI